MPSITPSTHSGAPPSLNPEAYPLPPPYLPVQRGPILPCNEELSPPRDPREVRVGYVLLALAPLLLVPYPLELVQALSGLSSPVPVPLI